MTCRLKRQNGQLVLGLCLGLSLGVLLHLYERIASAKFTPDRRRHNLYYSADSTQSTGQLNEVLQEYSLPDFFNSREDRVKEHHFKDERHHKGNDSLARQLYKEVKVACWILTSPSNLDKKAIHVKNTWAKRCNIALFMSSAHNASFPTIGLNVSEGRKHLTAKTMKAFQYLYENHLNDADWFLKADDDTYVIIENLRYFLSNENTQESVYFGHRFKPLVKQGYTSGGGGYVLSKEALTRFGSEGAKNPQLCTMNQGSEDVDMGMCLENLGVKLKPSVDAMHRTRFHCFSPETMLRGTFPKWYGLYDAEGGKSGIDNISDYAISFHYVRPDQMYLLEFLTYHLQPYGISNLPQALNVKK